MPFWNPRDLFETRKEVGGCPPLDAQERGLAQVRGKIGPNATRPTRGRSDALGVAERHGDRRVWSCSFFVCE